MGMKDVASETMEEAGVPIVPGSQVLLLISKQIKSCERNWLSSHY